MDFTPWLLNSIRDDYLNGSCLLGRPLVSPFAEAEDYAAQGYRKIKAKFGPMAGQLVWWKKDMPLVPVGQEKQAQPMASKSFQPTQPVPTSKPQFAGGPLQPRSWVLSTVIGENERGLKANQKVAVSKRPDGNWDFVSIDGPRMHGWLPGNEIARIIKSEKDASGQPLRANDPKEFKPKESLLPNEYQQKIIDEFKNTNNDITVGAGAGSGKTTLLRELTKYKKPGEKWLYLVFGKQNQIEASKGKKAFPKEVDVRTSHSFVGQVLRDNAKMGTVPDTTLTDGNDKKLGEIMSHGTWFDEKALSADVPRNLVYTLKSRVKKLTALAKNFSVNPMDKAAPEQVAKIIKEYQIDTFLVKNPKEDDRDYTPEMIELTIDVLHDSLPNNSPTDEFNGMRDQDDTLWWAALLGDKIRWPKYDVCFCDESQDFNVNQQILVDNLKKRGARIVVVGDKNQAIFGFRGSDIESFDKLLAAYGNMHKMPVNYRSGKAIIAHSNTNTHVKDLIAGMEHEGEVTTHQKYHEIMDKIKSEWNKHGQLNMETAFISRTNKPLVHVALSLMKDSIPFVIIGRDFATDMIKFVEEIVGKSFDRRTRRSTPNVYGIDDFEQMLHHNLASKEREWGENIRKDKELQELKDQTEALANVLNFLKEHNWKDLQTEQNVETSNDFILYLKNKFGGLNVKENEQDANRYEQIKEDPQKVVTLITSHKAKGLEFDRVFLVRNDLFPHPSAKTPKEFAQEDNLKHITYTRPRHEFHVASDAEPGGKAKR